MIASATQKLKKIFLELNLLSYYVMASRFCIMIRKAFRVRRVIIKFIKIIRN